MCDKYLGPFSGPNTVISNGAPVDTMNSISKAESDTAFNVITASRWRPQKRLTDIVECFLGADIPDSTLFVAGNLKQSDLNLGRYQGNAKIKFLGVLSQPQLQGYLHLANSFVHLSWIDWCPNSVVEAICSCKPVITNNVGGTHEIVAPSNGFVCDIDKPYDLNPVKLYVPPKFDRDIVSEAILKSLQPREISNSHLDIKLIAQQYVSFFSELLK